MIAILSATEHDYYAMPLPFAVYSWAMIGVHCIVFVPKGNYPKLEVAKKYCNAGAIFYEFEAEEKRIPTYSQVSRLFGAAIPNLQDDEVLITGDSDMAVFTDYFQNSCENGVITIIGSDLTPQDQYPMCYISMSAEKWRKVFGITKTAQEHIAELIDPIEGQNIRGEQWSYDQWYAKKKLNEYLQGPELRLIVFRPRAKPGTQFASRRADRDGWHFDPYDIIDAHLPRPLTDEANFEKVIDLFKIKFPNADFAWAYKFREEYMSL